MQLKTETAYDWGLELAYVFLIFADQEKFFGAQKFMPCY
jgi:hypothetical protein